MNDTLHNMIYEHPFYDYDIELAIRECAESIDKTFVERARREDIYDGTTAIGVFFHSKSSQRPDTCSSKVEFPVTAGEGEGVGRDVGDVGGDLLTRQYSIADPSGLNQSAYGQQPHGHPQPYGQQPIVTRSAVRQTDTRMTVFNIGDSRAVLCRNGVAICSKYLHESHHFIWEYFTHVQLTSCIIIHGWMCFRYTLCGVVLYCIYLYPHTVPLFSNLLFTHTHTTVFSPALSTAFSPLVASPFSLLYNLLVSEAHCPSRPDEQLRVETAKGWITEEKELFVGRLHRMDLSDPDIADQAANGIQWTTIYRVLGECEQG